MMNPGHRSCTASASKAFHVDERGTQLDSLLCGQVVGRASDGDAGKELEPVCCCLCATDPCHG
jgi:hypothetical protein